jgi:hypothetical protein
MGFCQIKVPSCCDLTLLSHPLIRAQAGIQNLWQLWGHAFVGTSG